MTQWSNTKASQQYTRLPHSDDDVENQNRQHKRKSGIDWRRWSAALVLLIMSCTSPSFRREWRSLSQTEQLAYLDAVKCLISLPSITGLNQTLYDDFPYIHSRVGNYSHGTTAFLPWHRHILHVYESTLREKCNYNGHLTLDWQDIPSSPVFDSTYGFGGNGNLSSPKSVAYGHCVTDGPFANMQALYFGVENITHCFSRGFVTNETKKHEIAAQVRPDNLRRVLESETFERFFAMLEYGPHNAIPKTIRGDFFRVTAPYDPLFFLHHTQLDRLWWQWQQADVKRRVKKLSGKFFDNATDAAQVHAALHFGDFGPDVEVSKVLDTKQNGLCYVY
ncbi:hypothetical protein N0V90_011251 [Kalmusia sp. IMI 367209]|nr:hypothetical protein N0V90_011251 [Kalmusia sp. IMI 367209]